MKANFCFLQHFKNLIRYSVGDVLTLMMWDFSGFNQIKLLGLYCSWQTETVMKCYFNLDPLAKRWKYVQRRKMCEMAIMHKYFSQNDQQSLWADTYLHTKHVHSICFTNFPLLISFLSDNIQRIWREVVRAESEQPWMSIALSAITALPREGWNLFSSTMMLINLKYHWNYNMAKKPCQIVSTQLHVCTASQRATFSFLREPVIWCVYRTTELFFSPEYALSTLKMFNSCCGFRTDRMHCVPQEVSIKTISI